MYLLSAGFSLAFGSMFTKTYRVHRIFTRSRSGVVKNKVGRHENNNSPPTFVVHIFTIKRKTNICCDLSCGAAARSYVSRSRNRARRMHKSQLSLCTFQLLQDTQLIILICVLLLIDCLVVTLWVTLDPMQRHLRNLTLEISPQDRGVVYQPQVKRDGDSRHVWLVSSPDRLTSRFQAGYS